MQQQRPGDPAPGGVVEELDGPRLVEQGDPPGEELVMEAADDLDAGEVPAVHRAVERLTGERLLVDVSVVAAVEEDAEAGLQLGDHARRVAHQRPGELLVVEELAALDGVAEVQRHRVARVEHDVEAALHEPRAAALADQALGRHDDVEPRIGVIGVQRRHQAGAATTQDQDIAAQLVVVADLAHLWP